MASACSMVNGGEEEGGGNCAEEGEVLDEAVDDTVVVDEVEDVNGVELDAEDFSCGVSVVGALDAFG